VQGATSDQANRYEGGNLAETNGQRSAGRGRGKVVPKVCVDAQIFQAEVPTCAGFKGYEDFLLQDLVRARVIRYRRERWVTPNGRTVIASLSLGVTGHILLRRFVLARYHQGQVTVPRLVAQLRAGGLASRSGR
jgi:hypothetical protein